jgi:hypothetical protein
MAIIAMAYEPASKAVKESVDSADEEAPEIEPVVETETEDS